MVPHCIFIKKTIRRVQKVASPVRSQEPTCELSPRKPWKTSVFTVLSAPLVSLAQENHCFLLSWFSLAQENHCFYYVFGTTSVLSQRKPVFYCVFLSLAQENHCFTVFSAPLAPPQSVNTFSILGCTPHNPSVDPETANSRFSMFSDMPEYNFLFRHVDCYDKRPVAL